MDQSYKMHVRSHLDYCDFIYHKPKIKKKEPDDYFDESDSDNHESDDDNTEDYDDTDDNPNSKLNYQMRTLESLQYQAALAVTGAWKGTSTQKIYEELGWETLHHRRWSRRITQFYKIMNGLTPQYLLDPIPMPRRHLFGRHATNDLYEFSWRNLRFLHSFYPDSVITWNNLGPETRNIETLSGFKKKLLETIKPKVHSFFNIHDPDNVKYLFQLRVGLSLLKSHKKNQNFKDTPNDDCHCGTGIESTEHFLLVCPLFTRQRENLFLTINPVLNVKIQNFVSLGNAAKTQILLYGNEHLNCLENKLILNATIEYIRCTERLCQV